MSDAAHVAAYAESHLPLAGAALTDEYYYSSPTLCIIDAVYSIGVRYEGVQAVVRRYCERFKVVRLRHMRGALPPKELQEPLSSLCTRIEELGPDRMSVEVFANRQRTSTRSGILKAEAVGHFANALRSHGIEYFQDVATPLPNAALEQAITQIPGQASGIALRYFWMLAGSDDLIKPDRMILRFLQHALGRDVQVSEAQRILSGAAAILRERYPALSPRLLDYKIWESQRRVAQQSVRGDAPASRVRPQPKR